VSGEYYFLISSLPLLRLDELPPLSDMAFLELCQGQLSPTAVTALAHAALVPQDTAATPIERRWYEWETWLRNHLVRARASRSGADADAYFRNEADVFPGAQRLVDEALAAKTPAVRERMLDDLRWQRLNDLSSGHIFDFAALVLYRLRLLLVEKQHAMQHDAALSVVDSAVEHLLTAAAKARTQVTT